MDDSLQKWLPLPIQETNTFAGFDYVFAPKLLVVFR